MEILRRAAIRGQSSPNSIYNDRTVEHSDAGQRLARLRAIYGHLWTAQADNALDILDVGAHYRPPKTLLDYLRPWISGDSLVLDAGCGRGEQGAAIASEMGSQIVCIDVLTETVELATRQMNDRSLGDRMHLCVADLSTLPFQSGVFDGVLSREMLVHVANVDEAAAEMVRVTKRGGLAVIQTSVETELITDREAEAVYRPLEIARPSMLKNRIETAFRTAGYEIREQEDIGAELYLYYEATEGRASREFMRAARLLQEEGRLKKILGLERFEVLLALYRYHVYHLLGKLSTLVYVLEKRK
jgi:ubiquinone/menaquinone biosynthesis C-methylase UbiE